MDGYATDYWELAGYANEGWVDGTMHVLPVVRSSDYQSKFTLAEGRKEVLERELPLTGEAQVGQK